VDYVAEQLDVPVSTWFDYPLKGQQFPEARKS
jgi:hypothetical protein